MWCVIVGGAPVRATPGLQSRLMGADRVVAADRGARTALACGLTPDLVLGDFDSLDRTTLAQLRRQAIPCERYPTDKDKTDGELALDRALAWGATTLTIIGGLGGPRLDHGLANLLLLGATQLAGRRVTLLDNRNEVRWLRAGERCAWMGEPGELVSLLAIGGPASGVTTSGLRWPLHKAHLAAGSTQGVSNEVLTGPATVQLACGDLLVTRSLPAHQRDWPPNGGRGLLDDGDRRDERDESVGG